MISLVRRKKERGHAATKATLRQNPVSTRDVGGFGPARPPDDDERRRTLSSLRPLASLLPAPLLPRFHPLSMEAQMLVCERGGPTFLGAQISGDRAAQNEKCAKKQRASRSRCFSEKEEAEKREKPADWTDRKRALGCPPPAPPRAAPLALPLLLAPLRDARYQPKVCKSRSISSLGEN